MTTGKRYQHRGQGPAMRIAVLQKEIELIDLERLGHREMAQQLRWLKDFSHLTPQLAREVFDEIAWRDRECRRLGECRRLKTWQMRAWRLKLEASRERTRQTAAGAAA